MKLTKPQLIKYISIGVIAVIIASIWSNRNRNDIKESDNTRDYQAIIESGILKVVTEYNSISYYLDNDTISGFHYELINAFAKAKGLKAEITPEISFEKRVQGLDRGDYDLIASNIPTTSQWKDSLLLTTPITKSKQILVQRKEENDSAGYYIKSQLELAHKTLYVEKRSPFILRIRNLEEEIADTIYINEVEKYGPEQLIAMVAHRDIDYAVVDETIATASIDSFPQLDIQMGISFNQFYSWGVNKESTVLLDSLNGWLKDYLQTKEFGGLYQKYFKKKP